MKKTSLLLVSSLMILSFPAFSAEQKAIRPVKDNYISDNANTSKYKNLNIIDVLTQLKMFNTYLSALKQAGLTEMFKGKGGYYTVFAPNDKAFAKIPKASLDKLMKDKVALRKLLLFHLVSGTEMSKDIVKKKNVKTVEGSMLKISQKGKRILINDSDFLNGDIKTKNGVIHIIDTVLPFIK